MPQASAHTGGAAERVTTRGHLAGAAGAVVAALAWALLARWQPTTTFHLAPFVVAAAWAAGLRRGTAAGVAARDARVAAFAGAVVAVLAAVLLAVADLLRGPVLWGSAGGPGSIWWEIVPAVAFGAWSGQRYARRGTLGGSPWPRDRSETNSV